MKNVLFLKQMITRHEKWIPYNKEESKKCFILLNNVNKLFITNLQEIR